MHGVVPVLMRFAVVEGSLASENNQAGGGEREKTEKYRRRSYKWEWPCVLSQTQAREEKAVVCAQRAAAEWTIQSK